MVFQVSGIGAIQSHVESVHPLHLVQGVEPDDPVCHDFSNGVLSADGHVLAAPVQLRERGAVLQMVHHQV